MAERPILFSAPLVRAILDGRKTETRRLMTKATCEKVDYSNSKLGTDGEDWGSGDITTLDWAAHEVAIASPSLVRGRKNEPCTARCKGRDYCSILVDGHPSEPRGFGLGGEYLHVPGYGGETRQRVYCRTEPGDVLYVRETWQPIGISSSDNRVLVRYGADGIGVNHDSDVARKWITDRHAEHGPRLRKGGSKGSWPSIHMPKWASRIRLRVTEVRAERLQEITDRGARAEGIDQGAGLVFGEARNRFAALWDSIYSGEHAWAANPWVWVWRFEIAEVKS